MPAPRGGPGKRTVVVGEDDEPIAVLLRDAINDEPGYQAVIEPDGSKVVDTCRSRHADLLILDIMMPGLGGFEIHDQLRADRATAKMPIIFISAAVGHFSEDFLRRGITEVIAKPFDLNDVLDRIQKLCPPVS